MLVPAVGVATAVVGAVSAGVYGLGPAASGASGVAAAVESMPSTRTVAVLEQERQQMITMSAAARTFTVAARPTVASPAAVDSNGPSSTAGGAAAPADGVPDPRGAQLVAYRLMSRFGFQSSSQFNCLVDLWNRESGWQYDAENASGAYGIPQALPGAKMASAGSNWATDPTTQITWGLGYIKNVYGSPCAAWNFELANGYY